MTRESAENVREGFWSSYVHQPARKPTVRRVVKKPMPVSAVRASARRASEAGAPVLVVAARFKDRLTGFLVPRPPNCLLLIAPCHSIHTFGMKYELDVAFFDSNGKVLLARERVKPARTVRCPGAYGVLERRSTNRYWYHKGETVKVTLASRKGKQHDGTV